MIGRYLEERPARPRSIGLGDALSIHASTRRRLIKSTVAGTVAWEAAALLHSPPGGGLTQCAARVGPGQLGLLDERSWWSLPACVATAASAASATTSMAPPRQVSVITAITP
jgi:hypothetical protein